MALRVINGCIICFGFLLFGICFFVNAAVAQDSSAIQQLTVEDYMKSNEPAQGELTSSEANKAEEGGMLSRLQQAIEGEPEGANQDDALPQVNGEARRIDFQDDAFIQDDSLIIDERALQEQSEAELEEEIRREAFDAAITGLFPMRPEQIRALLLEYDATKRVTKEPVHGIPTPQVNVATVSLDPGVAPMIVTTATGHVTTLNVLDITGAPWPIKDISWAGDFEVIEPTEGGHIIRVTPLDSAAYGNMSIQLLTLKTPVTIMLKTSKDEVQYRVDARIPEYGPFAQASLIQGGTERVAGNALITSILDGVPPGGASRLNVSGVDGRTTAYNISGMTYLRTPLTLLSPGWEQSVSSADGMNVYALDQAPVLLLSDRGRFVRASLDERKDSLNER